MNHRLKQLTVSLMAAASMIITATTVPAAQETIMVGGNAAVYVGQDVIINGGSIQGDAFLGGNFNLQEGKTDGDVYLSSETQNVKLPAGVSQPVIIDRTLQFPDGVLMPEAAPKVPAAQQQDFVFSWWPEVTLQESGTYRSITAENVMNVNTADGDVVLVTDQLVLKNSIKITGSHDLIIYTNSSVNIPNTSLQAPDGGQLQLVVTSGDLTVSGSTSLQANIYVPNGNVMLENTGMVTGLVAAGGAVSLSGAAAVNGMVHAPQGRVTLAGSSSIQGCVAAKQLELSWGTQVLQKTVNIPVNSAVSGGLSYPVKKAEQPDTAPETSAKPEVTPEPGQPQAGNLPADAVQGLKAEYYAYYDDGKLEFPAGARMMTRRENNVRFNWGWEAPDEELNRKDRFSVRITGYLVPKESGHYTFTTWSDDGVHLEIGGAQVIDRWEDMALTYTEGTPLYLEAGKAYAVELAYYDNTEVATLHLFWTKDGNMEIVPADCFFTEPMPEKQLYLQKKNGLKASYYNDQDAVQRAPWDPSIQPALVTVEPVNIWTMESPYPDAVNEDGFSVWYEGFIEAPKSGKLKLEFVADDGIQVTVNNQTVIDEWHANNTDQIYSAEFDVVAGEVYPITILYQEQEQLAACQMLWSMDGIERQIVPDQYLYPAD